jgi:predicted peroxiredoxin
LGTILCVGTRGWRDPNCAAFPFAAALTALAAGHQPQIVLMGDATALLKDGIAERVPGGDWPPLGMLLERVIAHDVPLFL